LTISYQNTDPTCIWVVL